MSDTSLVGRAVIITGAGRGLGRSYARHLARLGARVVVNDRDEDAHGVAGEIRATGGDAL
ncbi:MAG: SDR family NAD(P)-dependent oxidoreductase, partial [Pseudonocardiaceae bacterium]|nr:SDR family NAD(P)-dependent oxidoreductase [Pseudonocardiaceae bacterium]